MASYKTEHVNGMVIDWDVPIEMDDGIRLRADVFRPSAPGHYPVLLTYGPYAKGLAFQDGYPSAWERLIEDHPDVSAGSSNRYQNWEVVDPEKWVPDGYVCIRVDSRGCGRSPGYVQPFSPRETSDFEACIEWAGVQPWSNGKVGLNGVSYYGINQWQVASRQPKHLAAMCVWEGAADWYRDMTHHGGILSTFWANWYDMQVKSVQYGLGENGPTSAVTGELVCGPETLDTTTLANNRCDFGEEIASKPLDGPYYHERSPDWSKITTPLLTAANWGGQGLHLRGNVEGFLRAATQQKWLEAHGLEHWTEFYTDYGVALQKRFFDYFLRGIKNGWDQEPKVRLQVRHVDHFEERCEDDWPIPRTEWSNLYLEPATLNLQATPAMADGQITFDALGDGVTFTADPMSEATEITGPVALQLVVSSNTTDADLFVVLRVFDEQDEEITFAGAVDPHTPIGQGWLRASHRKLDPELSQPGRPYHTHDEPWPLTPGTAVPVNIEIWPTSIVVPKGCRIALTVRGRDYEYAHLSGARLSNFKNELKGCGPFLHDDPRDRPKAIFGGQTTIHFGADRSNVLLLPVIPPKSS